MKHLGLGQFVVAHAQAGIRTSGGVPIYRTYRRASLRTALKKAAEIRGYGYLVWIEAAERTATR